MRPFHCHGAAWQGGLIAVHGRDAAGERASLAFLPGREVAIAADGPRRCIGATPPGHKGRLLCPEGAELTGNLTQCPACQEASWTLPCMICTGERCANRRRHRDCIQPDNHAVYLAAWADETVKVGVARWERRFERLSEQGARAALIVARADGREARLLETHIKHTGLFSDRYAATERLAAWATDSSDPQALSAQLRARLNPLLRRVPSRYWLPEPLVAELPQLPTLPSLPRLLHPLGLCLRGTVQGCYGDTLVAVSDIGELVALVADRLAGLQVREPLPGETAAEQLAFATAV